MMSSQVGVIFLSIFILFSLKQIQGIENSSKEQLATKIRCEKDEIRDYRYSSQTSLWGEVDGKIVITADMRILCLGDDTNGKFGPEGLKYLIQLDNLHINDKAPIQEERVLKRRKRGFMDSVSGAWRKVKKFFKRMLGLGGSENEEPAVIETEERIHTGQHFPPAAPEEEESPDDFNYQSLYSEPFQFVQLPNGSVPEVQFSDEDKDARVRNFKRHLVDAFTTQLNMHPRHEVVVETTVLGEHLSNYNISVSEDVPTFSSPSLQIAGIGSLHSEAKDEKTVVVEKHVTEDDILSLAPHSDESAINDKEKMGLQTRQIQIFKDGQLFSTSGTSSLELFDTKKKKRGRRAINENKIMSFFQVRSSFEIQFQNRRRRRSTDNHFQSPDEDYHFSSASRAAEFEESSAKQKIKDLQKSIGNTTLLIHSLLDEKYTDQEEKLELVFDMVVQEVRYGLDHEPQSIAEAIRKTITQQFIDGKCPKSLKNCKDLLQLLARAGGTEAEHALLSYVNSESTEIIDRQEVADLLSDISNPSSSIVDKLIELLQADFLDSKLIGPLSLSASNMAAIMKNSEDSEKQRTALGEVLINILRTSWTKKDDALAVDALEAIGNLGHESTVDAVLEISDQANDRVEIQVACAHALRHVSSSSRVQKWMLNMIRRSPSCDVKHAIVGSLLDQIHVQELAGNDKKQWPRFFVNAVDIALRKHVESASPEFSCALEDTIRYFQRKRGDEAKNLVLTNYFGSDSEAWEPDNSKGTMRKKREAILKNLNCREWTEDNKYRPIQDKDEFAADRATYNKSRSCLASRRLGLDNANAEIYAGMFAGVKDTVEKEERPKYKLLTKFVSGMNFMGHEMEIGSFYFYHHSGYTKAYVRILGRTRQEFRHEGCTPNDLKYRPITHIPLYRISVSVLQLSLGIHLSSQLSLNTECPKYDVYDLRPMSDVRIAGEAMGTVLFARAALNLGGNFNYHLLFSFAPNPDMCLKGEHGYEPMSVSMEAYFRLWNIRRLRWGKPITWKPSSFIWDLNSGDQQPWFNDTCILSEASLKKNDDVSTTTQSVIERRTESHPEGPLVDDDNLLVVEAV